MNKNRNKNRVNKVGVSKYSVNKSISHKKGAY